MLNMEAFVCALLLLCSVPLGRAFSTMTNSNDCIVSCLNKGKIFCPGQDMKVGYCCDKGESCPQAYSFCSNNAVNGATRDFMCPFESYCGSSYLLSAKASSQSVSVVNQNGFVKQDACHYQIMFPTNADPGDAIQVSFGDLKYSTIYVNQSPDFVTFGKEIKISTGQTVKVTAPNNVYITAYASNVLYGSFSFSYKFLDLVVVASNQTANTSAGNGTKQPNNSLNNSTSQNISSGAAVPGAPQSTIIIIVVVIVLAAVIAAVILIIIRCIRKNKRKIKVIPSQQKDENKVEAGEKHEITRGNLLEKTLEADKGAMLDQYYLTGQKETPKQLKKQFYKDDLNEDFEEGGQYISSSANSGGKKKQRPPTAHKQKFQSDRESFLAATDSKFYSSDGFKKASNQQTQQVKRKSKAKEKPDQHLPPRSTQKRRESQQKAREELEEEEPQPQNNFFGMAPQAMAMTAYAAAWQQMQQQIMAQSQQSMQRQGTGNSSKHSSKGQQTRKKSDHSKGQEDHSSHSNSRTKSKKPSREEDDEAQEMRETKQMLPPINMQKMTGGFQQIMYDWSEEPSGIGGKKKKKKKRKREKKESD